MQTETVANLLLVDDDAENLASLQLALESDGHHVSIAGDASRAMEMLMREPIELVVTDYEMPGMDGAEFCRQVRAQPAHRDLPIVMLSAGPEPVCVLRCWTLFSQACTFRASHGRHRGPDCRAHYPVTRARRSDDVRKPESRGPAPVH
ncbi:response regulator [Paraburkholderia hospita]|uniref:response regulator n=1 Tax=Paraburkholderia hospita TaxID=169430 RepID=UPI001F6204A0|nr:response regulator [Paraburkholderia hospita]